MVLNSGGTIVGSQLYGPYGNQRYSTGTLPTSIGFTGQHTDSVTGLDYYVARYYDPVVGVFLSPDSVQGNAQGMEPYTYVGGNPETATDPTGQRISCPPDCGTEGGTPGGTPCTFGDKGCGDNPCGTGTHADGGQCVPNPPDCGSGTVRKGNGCVLKPDHTKAKNDARKNHLLPGLILSIAELAGGGIILLLLDIFAIKGGIDEGDVPAIISLLGDMISTVAEIASAISLAYPNFSGIAYGITAVLHGFLAIANGVLWAYNAAMSGWSWLKGVVKAGLQLIGKSVQGAPGLLFDAAKEMFGKSLTYGGRMVGQSLMAEGATGVALYASQSSINIDDWCTQYGQGEAACTAS